MRNYDAGFGDNTFSSWRIKSRLFCHLGEIGVLGMAAGIRINHDDRTSDQ